MVPGHLLSQTLMEKMVAYFNGYKQRNFEVLVGLRAAWSIMVVSKGLPSEDYSNLPRTSKSLNLLNYYKLTIILETERLLLRETSPDDAESVYLLNMDPEVIQYTGDEPFASVAEAQEFLSNYTSYKKYGFGRWAVICKTDQEFLGWCGLKYTPELDEFDIGFRFFKKYWNQGYATEAAKACIELGFNKFQMPVIVGRVMKANIASIRVLEKIGLAFYENFDFGESEDLIYRLEKP